MSLLRATRRRSPAGLLYPYPEEPPHFSALGGGWLYRGSAEFGVFWDGGDEKETRFERYTEWTDEAFLSSLSLGFVHPETGRYLEFVSGGLGREDQFYRADLGQAGLWRIRGSFSQIPRRFASDARVLFAGAGRDVLTLPAGLTPGDSSNAEIDAALAGIGESSLELRRDRSQITLELRLRPDLKLVGSYGFEDRRGARPFGGAFSFPPVSDTVGGVVETVEPIDQRTQNISAGLEYSGERLQTNLYYRGSFFRNRDDSLTFENPFRVTLGPGGPLITQGRFALAPDNDWHNLKAQLAVELPLRSRFTGTLSWSTMRQDEDLLPPTINSGPVAPGTDLDDWNDVAALSRDHAEARIDTFLADAVVSLRPWKPLRLKARLRYFERDNDTSYSALNPITGQHGYIVEDGAQAAQFFPLSGVYLPALPGSKWRIRNAPYGERRLNYELAASYRPAPGVTFGLELEREQIDRDAREREETHEDRIAGNVTLQALEWATLRVAYTYAGRNGGSLDPGVTDAFFSSSLPGYVPAALGDVPPGLPGLVRPALANRTRQIWDARLSLLLRPDLDLSLAGRLQADRYRSDFGLQRERSGSLSLECSFQPSPDATLYAFASLEGHSRDLSSVRGVSAGSDPANSFPAVNTWAADSDGNTISLGAGLAVRLAPGWRLQSDYSFLASRDAQGFEFNPAGTAPAGGLTSPATGSRLPDLRTRDHVIETSLRWELRESLALRLYHRYQRSSLEDFQQADLVARSEHRLLLAHADRDYAASVYGVMLQIRFD